MCPAAEDTSRTAEPDIHVVASFPEDNPFGRTLPSNASKRWSSCSHSTSSVSDADVVNGEKNRISLAIENRSDLNVTLTSIGGSFHHPESHALIKNVCAAVYGFTGKWALTEDSLRRRPSQKSCYPSIPGAKSCCLMHFTASKQRFLSLLALSCSPVLRYKVLRRKGNNERLFMSLPPSLAICD
jgi:hypothetical protein